jgi:hypothetical protein
MLKQQDSYAVANADGFKARAGSTRPIGSWPPRIARAADLFARGGFYALAP